MIPDVKVVASIEARMSSQRLPGKVLTDIAGRPTLGRVIDRLRSCKKIDEIIVATTDATIDDVIEKWCELEDVYCYRGSESNVLNRVVEAHRFMNSNIIVEITGDCPLLDPKLIDFGIETFKINDCDVVTNTWVPSYPQGADVQVYRFELLEDVERRTDDKAVLEHVSLYFYEHPEEYRLIHLLAPEEVRNPQLRLQLDYKEDLIFISEIFTLLEPIHGPHFGIKEILNLLQEFPRLREINKNCTEKPIR